jgi:hypothetical protein
MLNLIQLWKRIPRKLSVAEKDASAEITIEVIVPTFTQHKSLRKLSPSSSRPP